MWDRTYLDARRVKVHKLGDDFVGKDNLHERFGPRDDGFARAEDAYCDLLHVFTGPELDLDRRVPV